jgi:uncharacterized protein YqeY
MSLRQQIEEDLVNALKAGETSKKDTLRYLKSALQNAEINQGQELSDEDVVNLIQKEVKKRQESIQAYQQADKPELAAQEAAEAQILETYLPSQMSEAEINDFLTQYLAAHPTEPNQLGQAMAELSRQLKGRADLGLVSRLLKTRLGS